MCVISAYYANKLQIAFVFTINNGTCCVVWTPVTKFATATYTCWPYRIYRVSIGVYPILPKIEHERILYLKAKLCVTVAGQSSCLKALCYFFGQYIQCCLRVSNNRTHTNPLISLFYNTNYD